MSTEETRDRSGSSDGSVALSGPLVEFVDHYSGEVKIAPERIVSITEIALVDWRPADGHSKVLLTNGKCYVAKSPKTEELNQQWQHCLGLREQVNDDNRAAGEE